MESPPTSSAAVAVDEPDRGPLAEVVRGLTAVVSVVDQGPDASGATDCRRATLSLARALGQIEAALAQMASRVEQNGYHTPSGARSARAWLCARSELSGARASASLRMARGLRELPLFRHAWSTGVLGTSKISLLLKLEDDLLPWLIRDQEVLIKSLENRQVSVCAGIVARWRELALAQLDASPSDKDLKPEPRPNSVRIRNGIGNEKTIVGVFDALTGTELQRLIDAEITRAFQAGEVDSGDGKTLGQRQSDALMSLCRRGTQAAVAAKEGQTSVIKASPRSPVVVNVQVDLAWLFGFGPCSTEDLLNRACQAADGTMIPLSQVLESLEDATINLILGHLGLRSQRFRPVGEVTTSRLANASQRRMLLARDQACRFPGCDARASWAKAHHEPPFQHTHHTTIPEMVLLCPFHHRLRHTKGFVIYHDGDGRVTVETPSGVVLPDTQNGFKLPRGLSEAA